MWFLQFILYLPSFVGTLKNKIPEAALELYQLKIKQLSPDILKSRTNHKDNPFSLNCSVVPRSFLFVFHTGLHGLSSNNSWKWSYKEKTASLVWVSRLSFRFLWPCFYWLWTDQLFYQVWASHAPKNNPKNPRTMHKIWHKSFSMIQSAEIKNWFP